MASSLSWCFFITRYAMRRFTAIPILGLAVAMGCENTITDSGTVPATKLAFIPAMVTALSFRQVGPSFDGNHTCGVTTANQAYCWGTGHLGNGPSSSQHLTPVAVAGGLQFRQVSSGYSYTCGVTQTNLAYCWGSNSSGEVGDGTKTDRPTPVPVAGGHLFRQVSAGVSHTCGVTTGNLAYCWGSNPYGAIGDGTVDIQRLKPVSVAGGHHFSQVTTGDFYTCGVGVGSQGYCWGANFGGSLGDGTTTRLSTPVKVAGI